MTSHLIGSDEASFPPAPPQVRAEETRRTPGALHIAAVVLATILLAGMTVFMIGAFSDRDDAQAERRDSAATLRLERDRAEGAEALHATVQDEHRQGMAAVDPLFVSYDELVSLSERELELARTAQDAGANDPEARVDEYNDVTSRGNEVVDQYNAKLAELEALINSTVPESTTTA